MTDKGGVMIVCPFCDGRGRGYDPAEKPDVYEGRKLSRSVTCLACAGTGGAPANSEKGVGFSAYHTATKVFRAEQTDIHLLALKQQEKRRQDVLAKLTDEDLSVLGLSR